jgi:hypothetical protein
MMRRMHRSYARALRYRASAEGLLGFAEVTRWGLENLSDEQRAAADEQALRAAFFGAPGIAVVAGMARRWPESTARIFARVTPTAYRFLIGEARYVEPTGNRLEACAFRRVGGEVLCQRVCREPTEAFTRDVLHLPLYMDPAPGSLACHWRWGGEPPLREGSR